MNRGILCTTYVKIKKKSSSRDIITVYNDFYSKEPFVRVKKDDKLPKTKDVANTNFCEIAIRVVDERVIILSSIGQLNKRGGRTGSSKHEYNVRF